MKFAISGKIASGKSTMANYLVSEYNYEEVSFAKPLKDLEYIQATQPVSSWRRLIYPIAKDIHEVSGVDILTISNLIMNCFYRHPRLPGEKNRKLIQDLGTDVIRKKVNYDTWVKLLLLKHGHKEKVVISDMRFGNEFTTVRDNGFITVRVHVPEHVQKARIKNLYGEYDEDKLTHHSEVDLDYRLEDFDYILPGWLTLDAYYMVIDQVLSNASNVAHRG